MVAPLHFFDPQPLRWMGSKWRLADWIIAQIPSHVCYVEPFCGSCSVFFRKPSSKIEVLNDLDGDIVNFFRVLRQSPATLLRQIQFTPLAREEYLLSYKPCDDPMEKARRFYVRTRQSFGGTVRKSGFRITKNDKRGCSLTAEWKRLGGLEKAALRLQDALIESLDWEACILKYDASTTVFYIDPPYPKSTRSDSGSAKYVHEMDDKGHRRLAECLYEIKGMALVSSYDSPLYRELYTEWPVLSKSVTTNGNRTAKEFLWLSPNLVQAQQKVERLEPFTLPMFEALEDIL